MAAPVATAAIAALTESPDLRAELLTAAAPGGVEVAWGGTAARLVLDDQVASRIEPRELRDARVAVIGLDSDDPAAVWSAGARVGAELVACLPGDRNRLVQWLIEADPTRARRADHPTMAVVGGCGGAGASTLATALAMRAVLRDADPTLIDLDPLSGGLDLLLGLDDAAGCRWDDLDSTHTRTDLPAGHGVAVLTWRRFEHRPEVSVPQALAAIEQCRRGSRVTVVDLPRSWCGHDDLTTQLDVAVLLTPALVPSCLATRALIDSSTVNWSGLAVRLVPGASHDPDRVADLIGLPLVAVIDHDRKITADVDRGDPPGRVGRSPYGRAADQLLDLVAEALP